MASPQAIVAAADFDDSKGAGALSAGPRRHEPVLVAELIGSLAPLAQGLVVDATLGAGGHSLALLELFPEIRILGIDRDPTALALASDRLGPFGDRFRATHGRFSDLARLAPAGLAAVVADLGPSSLQLDDAARGFSFMRRGPLDMRYDPGAGQPLAELLDAATEDDLAEIIRLFGEERQPRRIARAVRRALEAGRGQLDTADLGRAVAGAAGRAQRRRIHPATRTFQALRIAVNEEMAELDQLLADAPALLAAGGSLAVISFHSLEDRKVKQRFAELARGGGFELLTRRPLRPQADEVRRNPRARSARLRAVRRRAAGAAPAEATGPGRRGSEG